MPNYSSPAGPRATPGGRALSNLGDPRARILAQRPGGGLGGKGVLMSSNAPRTSGNAPTRSVGAERSGPGSRGLGKTFSAKSLKRTR